VSELIAERLIDAEVANERPEPGETAVRARARIAFSG
jgi:hypothetical protein